MDGFYAEVIGSRSFASVWYWIMLALVWTRATHWTVGVSFDDARLAHKQGGQAMIDFETLIEINVRKTVTVFDSHNVFFTGAAAFLLATFFMLGFWFKIHFMQAAFLLVFPLAVVGAFSLRLAHKWHHHPLYGDDLYRSYLWNRRVKLLIGANAILFTAFWGVAQTLFSPYA